MGNELGPLRTLNGEVLSSTSNLRKGSQAVVCAGDHAGQLLTVIAVVPREDDVILKEHGTGQLRVFRGCLLTQAAPAKGDKG